MSSRDESYHTLSLFQSCLPGLQLPRYYPSGFEGKEVAAALQGNSPGILPYAKSISRFLFLPDVRKELKEAQILETTVVSVADKVENCCSEKMCSDRQCSVAEVEESCSLSEETLDSQRKLVNPRSVLIRWGFEWSLPGHGEPYYNCGHLKTKGCLNVEGHGQDGIFEDHAGKVFVRFYRRTCLRASCPICYESWAGKEAAKIEHRLRAAPKKRAIIHLVVSPPSGFWLSHGFEDLRRRAYVVSQESGFWGGSCIFHPFRENELTNEWYFSPHFHMIGYGWIRGTKEGFKRHGWVVKNAGIRKTVSGTALYQLSHAGIHDKYHTITWFGSLAYNKMRVPPLPERIEKCPLCGQKLKPLWYFGEVELPDEEGDYWLDPSGWMYKPRRFWGGG